MECQVLQTCCVVNVGNPPTEGFDLVCARHRATSVFQLKISGQKASSVVR